LFSWSVYSMETWTVSFVRRLPKSMIEKQETERLLVLTKHGRVAHAIYLLIVSKDYHMLCSVTTICSSKALDISIIGLWAVKCYCIQLFNTDINVDMQQWWTQILIEAYQIWEILSWLYRWLRFLYCLSSFHLAKLNSTRVNTS
jgi:hypothetical protein